MAIVKGHLLLTTLLLSAGCYTFRPASIESLPPGSTVRARLSPAGTAEVTALTGEPSERIEGSFVRLGPDSIVLEVWRNDLRAAGPVFAPGRLEVPVARRHVLSVSEKRLSYLRTGALSAALGLGLYQLYRLLWADAGGSTTGTPTPGGPAIIRCC